MSSGGVTPSSGLYGAQINLLRANSFEAHLLPEPGETWTYEDVPGPLAEIRRKFSRLGIIQTVKSYSDTRDEKSVYRTAPRVYEYIQANISRPRTFPCGHAGVRNLGGGRYSCQRDECDAEFDRETAREVLRG